MSNELPINIKYKSDIIKDDKVIALMCPKCFHLIGTIRQKFETEFFRLEDGPEKLYGHTVHYEVDGECENCNEYIDEYIEVDGDIAASISRLNQKGWKTNFCCSGHPNSPAAYIYFKNTKYLKYIGILPKGWRVDVKDYKNLRDFIIRAEYGKYDPLELYEWTTRLPILPDTAKIRTVPDKELIDILLNLGEDQLDFNDDETEE